MDLDLAFSQKKRGKRVVQKCDAAAAAACLSSVVYSSRFCLSLLVWALGLLLLGELSPKHKRSYKKVNHGTSVFLVRSSIRSPASIQVYPAEDCAKKFFTLQKRTY